MGMKPAEPRAAQLDGARVIPTGYLDRHHSKFHTWL